MQPNPIHNPRGHRNHAHTLPEGVTREQFMRKLPHSTSSNNNEQLPRFFENCHSEQPMHQYDVHQLGRCVPCFLHAWLNAILLLNCAEVIHITQNHTPSIHTFHPHQKNKELSTSLQSSCNLLRMMGICTWLRITVLLQLK